jgi:hypothetical protein
MTDGPDIYDEDVQEGMMFSLVAKQVGEGYFDDE